ncbi:MAG: hypoxanthine phosphoribosyltransferase [Bacteroidota bacterium]
MVDNIQVHDLTFQPFLSVEQIQGRVQEIGIELSQKFSDQQPVFLVMLKGAFVFATDLIRSFEAPAEVSFVRTQSYVGTESSKEVKVILGPTPEEVYQRDIIIVEDIVDSGRTMDRFLPLLEAQQPRSITLVTLLFKPDMLVKDIKIDHVGFTIPPKFVVGYGLDYDGLGRNLPEIYQLHEHT